MSWHGGSHTCAVVKFTIVGGPNEPKFVRPAATPPSESSFINTRVFVVYKVWFALPKTTQ